MPTSAEARKQRGAVECSNGTPRLLLTSFQRGRAPTFVSDLQRSLPFFERIVGASFISIVQSATPRIEHLCTGIRFSTLRLFDPPSRVRGARRLGGVAVQLTVSMM